MSDWQEKVNAHADGELDPQESAEVEALLTKDRHAANEHQWAVYLKETLRTKHVKPDHSEAWQAAQARLDAIDALQGSPKVEAFVGRFSWGFAAALFVLIVLAGFLNRGNAQLTDQQLAGVFASSTVEQPVESVDDLEGYVQRESGRPLPQIAPVYQVQSMGKGKVGKETFLKLEILDNSGPFLLFIFPGTIGFEDLEPISGRSEFLGGSVNGHTCVAWSVPGAAYMLVADRSVDEVVSMADRMTQ